MQTTYNTQTSIAAKPMGLAGDLCPAARERVDFRHGFVSLLAARCMR